MSAGFLIESTVLLLLALALDRVCTLPRQRAALGFIVVCALPLLWLADTLQLGWQPIVQRLAISSVAEPSPAGEWTWMAVASAYIWITLWHLLRWLVAHVALRRLTRDAQLCRSDRWQHLSTEVAAACGRRRLQVRVHAAVGAPFLAGPLRPFICIPAHLESCSEARARLVLLHEYAHLRAYDGWRVQIVDLVACLLWFHPLLQILRRRFLRDIELACDEQVLRAGADAHDYAATLAYCARRHRHLAAAELGMAVRHSDLVQRVRQILSADAATPVPVRRWMAVALGAVVLGLSALNLAPRTLVSVSGTDTVESVVTPRPDVAAIKPEVAEGREAIPVPSIKSALSAPSAPDRGRETIPEVDVGIAATEPAAPSSALLWKSMQTVAAEDAAVYAAQHAEPEMEVIALDPRFERGLTLGRAERSERRQRVMKRVWPLLGRVPL